jgi:magnesium-transporting ATPase (P-type)
MVCDQVDKTLTTGEEGNVVVDAAVLDADPTKSRALLLLGDLCVQGSAKGVTIATGDRTFLGKAIAKQVWPVSSSKAG